MSIGEGVMIIFQIVILSVMSIFPLQNGDERFGKRHRHRKKQNICCQ